MNDLWSGLLLHMSPAFVIGMVFFLNHRSTRLRTQGRHAADSVRLAAALMAELRALRDCYSENLDLIARESSFLPSMRGAAGVYRSNLNRATILFDERTLDALVTAYAQNERIEACSAGLGKPGPRQKLRPRPTELRLQEMKQRYVSGYTTASAAIAALRLVGQPAEAAEAAARPRSVPAMGVEQTA